MGVTRIKAVEIDIPWCSNTFGQSPCTAAGESCFNSRNRSFDCKDIANYSPTTKTLRFNQDNGYWDKDIPAIPSLIDARTTKAKVDPGRSIGVRATFSATFKNHPTSDAQLDPYVKSRAYDPYKQGTFWGKFQARYPYTEHSNYRVITGNTSQAFDDLRTEHFVVDKIEGPDSRNVVHMAGADFMRLLDDKTAQAPAPSRGRLIADVASGASVLTVEPAGVGDDYKISGWLAIGEEEFQYTRSADEFNLIGFTSEDHSGGDVVQEVLVYETLSSADIIDDLITHYSPLGAGYTDLPRWQSIVSSFVDPSALYSAHIVKPTSTKKLINELVEQAGLLLFPDNVKNKVIFDVLRPSAVTSGPITQRHMVENSFSVKPQPDKRFSQVIVFYNQKNVFKNLDEPSNFYGWYVNLGSENLYQNHRLRKIYSRWIPANGLTVAQDVATRFESRYRHPPRQFHFQLFAEHDNLLRLGQVFPLHHNSMEDTFGDPDQSIIAIVTGIELREKGPVIECEEFTYDTSVSTGEKRLRFDEDSYNVNLRDVYDRTYTEVDLDDPIIFILPPDVVLGSNSTISFSVDTGDWPEGAELIFQWDGGEMVGAGGSGGNALLDQNGGDGGPCLKVTYPIQFIGSPKISGGGGGGAGAQVEDENGFVDDVGGGGGAGQEPGLGGNGETRGEDGRLNTGGSGAGNGGDPGEPGQDASGISNASGGAAGLAIDGFSLIAFDEIGIIKGVMIN